MCSDFFHFIECRNASKTFPRKGLISENRSMRNENKISTNTNWRKGFRSFHFPHILYEFEFTPECMGWYNSNEYFDNLPLHLTRFHALDSRVHHDILTVRSKELFWSLRFGVFPKVENRTSNKTVRSKIRKLRKKKTFHCVLHTAFFMRPPARRKR